MGKIIVSKIPLFLFLLVTFDGGLFIHSYILNVKLVVYPSFRFYKKVEIQTDGQTDSDFVTVIIVFVVAVITVNVAEGYITTTATTKNIK